MIMAFIVIFVDVQKDFMVAFVNHVRMYQYKLTRNTFTRLIFKYFDMHVQKYQSLHFVQK